MRAVVSGRAHQERGRVQELHARAQHDILLVQRDAGRVHTEPVSVAAHTDERRGGQSVRAQAQGDTRAGRPPEDAADVPELELVQALAVRVLSGVAHHRPAHTRLAPHLDRDGLPAALDSAPHDHAHAAHIGARQHRPLGLLVDRVQRSAQGQRRRTLHLSAHRRADQGGHGLPRLRHRRHRVRLRPHAHHTDHAQAHSARHSSVRRGAKGARRHAHALRHAARHLCRPHHVPHLLDPHRHDDLLVR